MATSEQRRATAAKRNGNGQVTPPKAVLNELGEKIFLDRYALKDMTKKSLTVGDTVIVCVNQKTRQREIGTVRSLHNGRVSIELRDGTLTEQGIEDVDKPLETRPEQMMERVARGIAAIETEEQQQREWEQKFRWLLDDWKFVPGGRILTAAGTDQQLTFYNCMPPEQEILTAAGYKAIAEVAVGDLVVTHRNRLRRVLHKFERETEEPIYVFKTKKLGYDDLRVTGEHKVLVIRSEWINKHKSRDGLRLQHEPQWIPAKELKPGDFLAAAYNNEEAAVTPIYISEHVPGYEQRDGKLFKPQQRSDYHGQLTAGDSHYDVTDRLVIDADLCYLFGRWLGDGNVNHRTQTNIPSGIKIVFGLDEREEAEQSAQIIERAFGVPTSLKISSTERWLDLWVNSMALGQFFKAFFGCYSYDKQIPAQLMQLPHDLTLALLKGLFTADGYISDNKLGILLSNRVLATQVHQLLMRLGFLFSIKENTHKLGRRPAYRIQATANECWPLFKDFFGVDAPAHDIDLKYYFEHDGLRWLRIDEIAVEDYTGVVLDIEVEEDHSFVSAGVVVSNCYVVPSPHDSRRGIVETLSQMMEIMSRGGGVGINISTLRPRHAYVQGVNGRSSGSVSWGGLYSFVTGLIEQGGSRRGALMLILNVWHPDVVDFINAKREMGKITNANISVGITDPFMEAVKADADWELVFPDPHHPDYDSQWQGDIEAWKAAGRPVVVHKTVKAREIWNNIIESAWASAEPGMWFIDRANKMSNSWYFSPLICTNPCGEQPLPAFGICNLGALNLSRFAYDGEVLWDDLRKAVRYAVRFLDNVIDATPYFFDENKAQQERERRVGLGIMGLADMLIRLKIRYGSEECLKFLDQLGEVIASEAYLASADNAAEKGAFPMFDAEKLLQSGYMQAMPEQVRQKIREQGLRNVTLLTVAPTGTTGTMVGTSTGVEPYFSWSYFRKSRLGVHEERVAVVEEWEREHPGQPLPDYFINAMELAPTEHVNVQAALQRWIDSAISKTANVPNEYTVEQTRELYEYMYQLGCKGGTIYRDGSRDEQVLNLKKEEKKAEPQPAPAKHSLAELWNQPKIRPRPKRSRGITVQKHSPLGKVFVTVNDDDENEPLEVFVTAGKAGSDVTSMAEAMGRLMSLVLRVASPLTPNERLREIISQLKGIGGARSTGFGKDRVRSLPDAVAQALEECCTDEPVSVEETANGQVQVQLALPTLRADLCPSCGEAAFVHEEGCMHCNACGFSQC
jgi:ribonucleoside-diphosphate reductase alpha chain